MFHVHNESLNIWSHTLAFVLAVAGLIATVSFQPQHMKLEDILLLCVFFLMSSYTFLASTLFHTLLCVSKEAHDRFICLDFSGVSAILACCAISYTWPLYECHKTARLFWIVALLLVNTAGIIGPSHKIWMTVEFKNGRVAIYACSALLSLLPFICYFAIPSTAAIPQEILTLFSVTLLQLGIGSLFFALKMPERFIPGFFDIWANSHAIFHILAMGAMFTMWQTILLLINWKNAAKFCMA
jgi:adiponectin receptor